MPEIEFIGPPKDLNWEAMFRDLYAQVELVKRCNTLSKEDICLKRIDLLINPKWIVPKDKEARVDGGITWFRK